MKAMEKMSLFLEVIWALLYRLIIREKGKDVLILGERPTLGLDDTTLTTEEKYPINFKQLGKRFVLSLHYNGSNSILYINAKKVISIQSKKSEIKYHALCLGSASKDFAINNMKTQN